MNDATKGPVPTSTGSREEAIRGDILLQFLRGIAFAGTLFFGPILFIYVIFLIGTLLPPESKEAQDPTPDSFVSSSQDGS